MFMFSKQRDATEGNARENTTRICLEVMFV